MFSKTYSVVFIVITTAVAALLLGVASQGLKPRQEANAKADKMMKILQAMTVEVPNKASAAEVEKIFTENVRPVYVDASGKIIDPATYDAQGDKEATRRLDRPASDGHDARRAARSRARGSPHGGSDRRHRPGPEAIASQSGRVEEPDSDAGNHESRDRDDPLAPGPRPAADVEVVVNEGGNDVVREGLGGGMTRRGGITSNRCTRQGEARRIHAALRLQGCTPQSCWLYQNSIARLRGYQRHILYPESRVQIFFANSPASTIGQHLLLPGC